MSLSSTSSARMLSVISTSDVTNEMIKQLMLIPKTMKLASVQPLKMVNMQTTQNKKLSTPNACIDLMSRILIRRLLI